MSEGMARPESNSVSPLIEAMRKSGIEEAAIFSTVARLKAVPVGDYQSDPSATESPFPGVQKAFLRRKECAFALGISIRTMDRWLAEGLVRSVRIRDTVFIPVSELAKHQELAAA